MIFVIKECRICTNFRKFVKDTPRDIESVCGNCWDWEKYPTVNIGDDGVEYITDKDNYKPKYLKNLQHKL